MAVFAYRVARPDGSVGEQADRVDREADPHDHVWPLRRLVAQFGHDSPDAHGNRNRGQRRAPPGELGSFGGQSCPPDRVPLAAT